MPNFERDPSGVDHQEVDQKVDQSQQPTLPILSDNVSDGVPDNSIGEIPLTSDSTTASILDNNSQVNSPETKNKRRETALRQSQERLNRAKRIFGESEEEQRVNFEREYHKAGSLKRFSESLKRNGILISKYNLTRVRNSLDIPKLRSDAPVNKPRVKEESSELVRTAKEKGFIDKLPLGMQKVLQERYPREGEPKALSKIGEDMEITRERVRQKEVSALRRIKRLLEGKRQTESGPRDDINVFEVVRLYTEKGKTRKEIATIMDCSESTISMRLGEAHVKMRKGRPRKK